MQQVFVPSDYDERIARNSVANALGVDRRHIATNVLGFWLLKDVAEHPTESITFNRFAYHVAHITLTEVF